MKLSLGAGVSRNASLRNVVVFGVTVVAVGVACAGVAHATTTASLEPAATTLSGYINGSGGKIAVAVALFEALAGSALRFNPRQIGGAIGVSLLATLGYPFLTAGFTALI